jgi:pseudaminic acid synthase
MNGKPGAISWSASFPKYKGKMMPPEISINGHKIGPAHEPYIIAEISANHNGSIKRALTLIDEAKRAGADAVKLQTYTADTITLNAQTDDFRVQGGLWDGRTLYELYKEAALPWDWHKELFDYAREIEITLFSSPFDNTAVDFLEDLGAPAYKIASFEAVDLPLIEYVAKSGKPMIISTGMADEEEICDAVEAALNGGCSQLAILHCVSGYPAPPEDYNLSTIHDMSTRFGLVTGLSDHTLDNTTAVAGVALGASIIEKHFTLDRNGGGPDDTFSLEPKDLSNLCIHARTAWSARGNVNYGTKSSERSNVKFRRSLYAVNNIKSGSIITDDDVRSVRPGYGLPPKFLPRVIGSRARIDIEKHKPISWDDLDI